jgi:hypothetical protein
MSALVHQRTQIAAKLEAVEGTAETLAAADAFLAFPQGEPDPKIDPYERNPYRETLSPLPSVLGKRSGKFPFMTELAGSGIAGTAPFWGKLAKGCGMAETVVPVTSVAYDPASSAIPSMTLAAYMDGTIHKIWGARGSLKLNLEVGKPGLLNWDFQGADWSHLDGALLAEVTYATVVPPVFLNATFQIDGVDFLVEKVEFDLGNTLALRTNPNRESGHESCLITDRKGKITLDPEMVLAATKDIWTMWRTGAVVVLSAVLGSTPGNIVTITANFQLQDAKHGQRTGIRTTSLTALMPLSLGDDEFNITLT